MISQVTNILKRAPATVLEDMIGVTAIFIIIFVGLSLPGFV